MDQENLFLIDGNALLYRSYYAIQRLSTSQGFPTNAIFGFITTLRKIVNQSKPDFLGVVFDVKGPTVRHEIYKDYKAHRKPMPEDLVRQVPVLKDVIRALGIAAVELERYEADDVMATLAAQAARKKIKTTIVTTDKDLLQTIDASTVVYNPVKDITIDEASVVDFFGTTADQVIDVLALWGDPSDNIPGIPGIGEKTSKALIRAHGSLDKILSDLSSVKNPKIRERIAGHLEELELSRRLVTIKRDLDLELDLEVYSLKEPDRPELTRLFQELEFTSLLDEVAAVPVPEKTNYSPVFDEKELEKLAARITQAGTVALDTETDSVQPTRANLVGISFALRPGEAFYVPLGHDYVGAPAQLPKKKALRILKPILENPKIDKIGQNIKYDAIVLLREGIELKGISRDTMVLSYLLEPNWGKHNLERLALTYLRTNMTPYETIVGRGQNQLTMNKVPIERVVPYACQDADMARRLGPLLWKKVCEQKLGRLFDTLERPLIELLAQMEIWGVRVAPRVLQTLSREFEQELRALEKRIFGLAGETFNINSPKQLGSILFEKLGLPATKKTKITKGYSTSLEILEELALLHPLAGCVLDYRKTSKLKSTYADALPQLINPETGRIHTSYNQTVAATGRLSSSEPNLQNIPTRGERGARFRRAFIPDEGNFLLVADYSQIELRILAHLSEDPVLIETFQNDRDVHEETARRVFGELDILDEGEKRRRAKIINFSILYGTSAFSLSKGLRTSTAEAQRFIDRYFAQYQKVKAYLDGIVLEAKEKGYSETLFGRRRPVPELLQANRMIQQAGRRIALNTPIQGSAADLIKVAMLGIWDVLKSRKLKTRMILQVHDELVFDVPKREQEEVGEIVRDKMEHALDLKIPLKVHLGWGANWADAK